MSIYYPPCDWCKQCTCCPAHDCKECRELELIDESELGCPPGCTSPFCNCPGTD